MIINNKYITLTKIILVSLVLNSCSSVKAPEKNLTQVLPQHAITNKYERHANWWRVYNDPQLTNLVTRALAQNNNLLQQALKVNIALYQAKKIGAELVPLFTNTNASVGMNRTKNLSNKGQPVVDAYSANVSVQYELDLWQKMVASKNAATLNYTATVLDKEATKNIVVASVIDNYFYLQYLMSSIQLNELEISYLKEQQDYIYQQYSNGKLEKAVYLQAQQNLLNAENQQINLEQQLINQKTQLADLLNLSTINDLNIQPIDLSKITPTNLSLDLPLEVLANRPDLQAAEYKMLSAFKQAQASARGLYPSITLNGALNSKSDQANTLFNVQYGIIGVGINLPFLQWNKVKWQLKIDKAEYESLKLNFTASLNKALNEVNLANESYNLLKKRTINIKRLYQNSMQNSEINATKYEYSTISYKDFMDAKKLENQQHLSLLEHQYKLLSASNQVFKTMAGYYVPKKIVKKK